MKKTLSLSTIMIALLFNACAEFDELYSEVDVVHPTSKNYTAATPQTSIIKDSPAAENRTTPKEPKSVHIHATGHIIQNSFDQEAKLYLYTLLTQINKEVFVFYSHKKLHFTRETLVDVDILDNYLITAKKHQSEIATKSAKETKKIIKHKKRNFSIHEAIEEKINTF